MDADLWLLNSCTVKSPAEDHFRNAVLEAQKLNKFLVVAGCVPQGHLKTNYLKGVSVIGVQQIDRVVEVVEQTLQGHSVRLVSTRKVGGRKVGGAPLDLPKVRKNQLIEIIAINTGCLNKCTYCKTKHARGDLASYPVEEIVDRARQCFEEGCCEIWLTSEDLGAYGRDIGTNLPQLLSRLVEVIPDGCMMRLGMTNPPYILEHLEDIALILAHPRVYSFLHVPVQSGADGVLMQMRREYCAADFCEVVDLLKSRLPRVTIATDVICGFPYETDEDFEDTMDLVRKYRFPSLFINQFYPRPGTPAASWPRVPPGDVKRRTKAISELFRSYDTLSDLIGTTQRVLVTEISSDQKHLVGHTKCYEQVLLPLDMELMGSTVEVEIVSSSKFSVVGKILHVIDTERSPGIQSGETPNGTGTTRKRGSLVRPGLDRPREGRNLPTTPANYSNPRLSNGSGRTLISGARTNYSQNSTSCSTNHTADGVSRTLTEDVETTLSTTCGVFVSPLAFYLWLPILLGVGLVLAAYFRFLIW